MDDTVHIRADGDGPGLYFTQEKVVGGLLDLLRRGHVDEAVEVYARCTQDLSASLSLAARDDQDLLAQVANLLFRCNDYLAAGGICEELDEREKAAMLFERGKDNRRAAELYEALGDIQKAAQMYERSGAFAQAAPLYVQAGESARAASCYAQAGASVDAGAHYLAADRPDLAIPHLQETGADEEAFGRANRLLAECYIVLGALDRAQVAAQIWATEICTEETFEGWATVADIASGRGDRAEAQRRLDGMKATRPDAPEIEALSVKISAMEEDEAKAAPSTADGGAIVPFLEGFAHLRALPLFKALSLRDLRHIHAISTVKACPPGTFLLLEGQPAPGMWLILDGEVAVRRGGKDIAHLDAGAHVGEMSLVDGGPASADVVAVDAVRALQIERAGFERLLATNDHLALGVTRVLLREMCTRLRRTSAIVAGRD